MSVRHIVSCSSMSVSTGMQVANVGFFDVTEEAVTSAISRDTLFIHGSSDGGGSIANLGSQKKGKKRSITDGDCSDACGSSNALQSPSSTSTFCDPSCLPGWSPAGPRFGGHNCGANDASKYGEACRICYTDQEVALAADKTHASSGASPFEPIVHVVMCSTGNPPAAADCSDQCRKTADTVRPACVWLTTR